MLVGGLAQSAAFRRVLAGLVDLPIVVSDAEQAVATGAAVQAAAVLEQVEPTVVQQRWGLGSGVAIDDPLDPGEPARAICRTPRPRSMTDPFAALGLPPDADEAEVRAARRRLAKDRHPDAGGDAAGMAALNDAADRALRSIVEGSTTAECRGSARTGPDSATSTGTLSRSSNAGRMATDIPSFTVEALPVETFEALARRCVVDR